MAELGRLDEAVALQQRVIALDPLRTASHLNLAIYLTTLGRYDEAEAVLRKAIELQPQGAVSNSQLAIIQILRGKAGSAVELASRKPIRSGASTLWRWLSLPMATGPRPMQL